MMVLRSLLFVPGNSMRMIHKAATLPADALILDLEDAVQLADKETARVIVRDSLPALKEGGAYLFVRVNALSTGLTEEDINCVAVKELNGILLAKAERAEDIEEASAMLQKTEKKRGLAPGAIKIIPILESAKGIVNAYQIASAGDRVIAVAFGAGDYYRDLGRSVADLTPEQTELLYARSQTVVASRAAGVPALDTVSFGLLTDREGLLREARHALQLGFKGKMVIHPDHIETINRVFSPSPEEADYARRVVAAFEEAQKRGLGAISLDGKMIDVMNYTQAKGLVHFVTAIEEREKKRQGSSYISIFKFFETKA